MNINAHDYEKHLQRHRMLTGLQIAIDAGNVAASKEVRTEIYLERRVEELKFRAAVNAAVRNTEERVNYLVGLINSTSEYGIRSMDMLGAILRRLREAREDLNKLRGVQNGSVVLS